MCGGRCASATLAFFTAQTGAEKNEVEHIALQRPACQIVRFSIILEPQKTFCRFYESSLSPSLFLFMYTCAKYYNVC